MKPYLLLFLTVLAAGQALGQSIVNPEKQWSNMINYYVFPGPGIGTEQIRFTEDTMINSKVYKKVERSLDESQTEWSPYGYIRENAVKQVLYKILPADPERLLYDLDAQYHQTVNAYTLTTSLNGYRNLDSVSYYVRGFDSLLVGTSWCRRISLAPPEDTAYTMEQWVDSLGSMSGMLHNESMIVGCDHYTLLCLFENEELKYHNPDWSSCYYTTGTNEFSPSYPKVTITPNPVKGVSVLEITGLRPGEHMEICIYDPKGQIVVRSEERTFNISKELLSPGVYIYRLVINGTSPVSGKIIVL